jgi:hypothetical protein
MPGNVKSMTALTTVSAGRRTIQQNQAQPGAKKNDVLAIEIIICL